MGLREIHQGFEKLRRRLPMSTVENMPELKQMSASGSGAACDWEPYRGSRQRFGLHCELIGHVAASPAFMQRKTDIADGAPAEKHICASDIARGILGADSGVGISNVLVVGTEGSTPFKRMEMRFDDPEQVAAFFSVLAAALNRNGVDFHAARSVDIPATEIWLTCPLDNRKEKLLSGGTIHENGLVNPTSQSSPSSGIEPESSHFAGIQ
jgi:hypothetical protein